MSDKSSTFEVWTGVYHKFSDAPVRGPGFSGPAWVERMRKRMIDRLDMPADEVHIVRERNLLPIAAAMAIEEGHVSVLDFGGGPGVDFLTVSRSLSSDIRLEYHIVDNPELCELGRELFPLEDRLRFHEKLPGLKSPSIVHAGGVIQYLEDWAGLLAALCGMKPRYLLLSDVFAITGQQYVTVQNLWGSQVPHWILSFPDLLESVNKLGFRLVYQAPYLSSVLGVEGPVPMGNLPEKYRLKHATHLLFESSE